MKKLLYILFCTVALLGCSDFLDVDPDQQISLDEQLSTREGVVEAVSGIYRDIEDLVSSKVHTYPGILSGNMTFSPSITNADVNEPISIEATYNFQNTAMDSDFTSFYNDGYDIINQTNLILERADELEFFSAPERNQLKAELLAARAFAHYKLSLLFAQNINFTADGSHLGIVYNRQRLQAGEDFPARSSMRQTYEFLKQDLDEALQLFNGPQTLPAGPAQSYFNELTVTAVYSKIALQFNDWQRAADLAQETIRLSGRPLTATSDYLNQWSTDNDLDETLLSFTAPVTDEGNSSSSISAYYLFSSSNNYGDFVASGDLISLYESNDLRNQLYETKEILTSTTNGREGRDYHFSTKYQRDNNTLYTRLSDIYLVQAEALERLTPGNTLALQRLNAIRTRAGLTALTNSANLLEEIFLERRRELAFEASTFYDIMRYKKDIIRNQGCIAITCNLSYPSPFYIQPIPQSSVANNENMIQNEGY